MLMQPGQAGAGRIGGDPIAMLEQKVQELERWASEMNDLLQQVHPTAQAFLVPIAQAGKALQGQIQQLRQRMPGGGASGALAQGSTPVESAPVRPVV